MEKTGLFKLKKRIKCFFFFKRLQYEDSRKKRMIERKIRKLADPFPKSNPSSVAFVVSLTSYGKRVKDCLPYTLYSLLTQTVRPYKIAVYLDECSWNDDKLPPLLKRIQSIGVDFYYCDDLRSYKKLIPALRQFPDNPIITVDDDFYYHPRLIEWLSEAYIKSDKKTVLGQWGCIPEKKDGKYMPYNQWKECNYGDDNSPISFYGGFGTSYPPHIFDDEILNSAVFMSICPKGDDIWFWAMEERQGIKRAYIPHNNKSNHIYSPLVVI